MAIIVDADVIVRGERGTFDLENWLASYPEEQFELAAITVAELWHGVERSTARYKAERERYLQAVVQSFPVVHYAERTAFEHARIWAKLESSGKMIGAHDLIVAATALERGSAVASFNKRHFTAVRGLKVIEPK